MDNRPSIERAEEMAQRLLSLRDELASVAGELQIMARSGYQAIATEREAFETLFSSPNTVGRAAATLAMRLDRGALGSHPE